MQIHSLIPIISLSSGFKLFIIHTYSPHIAASSTLSDDVTIRSRIEYFMPTCAFLCFFYSHISLSNLASLVGFDTIYWYL